MRYFKDKKILSIIVIYLLLIIYLMIKNNNFYINIVNPIFWGCILAYWLWDIKRTNIKIKINKRIIIYSFLFAVIYIAIYIYIGFIVGFSKNHYNNQIIAIFKNFFVQIIPILGIELTRTVLIFRNRKNKFYIILITLILILLEINYSSFINLFSNKEELFKYINSVIIPLIITSNLYTYLAIKRLSIITLSYRILFRILILVLPVLPNTDWYINGSIDILYPIIVFLICKYKIVKKEGYQRKGFLERVKYTVILCISILLFCFMVGVFKYEPISILSNSMNPLFSRGDVVIFKKLEEKELQTISKGEIIVYTVGDKNIAHRVVNVIKAEETVYYQTKGDSNNIADTNLVETSQIQGVFVFYIKYIGFPSIWLYDFFNL